MADLSATLVAAMKGDRQAESQLNEWLTNNRYADCVTILAAEIATEGKPVEARQMASIYLKNTLYAKSPALQRQQHDRWKNLDAATRSAVKDGLLTALRSTTQPVPHFAALCAAEIAAVELPYREWPHFVSALTEIISGNNGAPTESAQLASLECLGYTCDRIAELEDSLVDVPELPSETVDRMLSAIVEGARLERSNALRLAAIKALKNSMIFSRKNMEVPAERNALVNSMVQAAQSTDAAVRRIAMECLEQLADLYYEKLPDYMTVIFQLTTEAMQKDADEEVKIMAVGFWTTVASLERVLLDEEADLMEQGQELVDRPPCNKYTLSAVTALVPLLLNMFTQQDEDIDNEDEWNLPNAGGSCLVAMSQTVEAAVVPLVMPFVQQNIGHENWRLRDAAIMAYTSILDGPPPDALAPYVHQSIAVLLPALGDPHAVVRCSATYCLAGIIRLHLAALTPEQLLSVLHGLMTKLQEHPRIASHACSAIYNTGAALKQPKGEPTNALSTPMVPLLQALMKASDRSDASEANLRVSALSAVSSLLEAAALDVQPMLRDLLGAVAGRVELALRLEVLSNDDRNNQEQLLGLLCGNISVLCQRLEPSDVQPHADRLMNAILSVLQVPNANCHEEAFLVIGAMASILELEFVKYLDALRPFLVRALRSFSVKSLCMVAVGVVVDLCAAVGSELQKHCDDIMSALMDCLRDGSVHRDVKPTVIACLGDVAMAIGGAFEPYLQVSTMFLMQAAQQQAPSDDDEMIEFIISLRLSILEAYSGIIIGLADGQKLNLFQSSVQSIMVFLQYLASPDAQKDSLVIQKAVALIGDIGKEFGEHAAVKQMLGQPFVAQLLQEASMADDENSRGVVEWTQGVLHGVLQSA